MYLTHLSLTNFRNFTRLDIDMPRGPLLLVGSNAQGKTSLLEAIYYLATFISFHAGSDRELINFLVGREPLAVTRIVADFQRGAAQRRIEVRVIQETNGNNGPRVRKEVLLDGVKQKISDVVGVFNAVLFLPQMLRVVEGSPEERRRYLNLAIAQIYPQYAQALMEFNQVLTQRNALLKQLAERNSDPNQLNFWDERLAFTGGSIILARAHALQELEQVAIGIHRELTRGQEVLHLAYQPSYDPLPVQPNQYRLPLDAPADYSMLTLDKIRHGFQEHLVRKRSEDIGRGLTTTGPHRDEFRFHSNGIDLGVYGSRGQVRTCMLSMKLAEVVWMKEKTHEWPVLLLDEVLAELDDQRREDLLSRLMHSEQSFLTTTDLDLFNKQFISQAHLWNVQMGRLQEVKCEK
jgi:DNA replication and repair protein RecF